MNGRLLDVSVGHCGCVGIGVGVGGTGGVASRLAVLPSRPPELPRVSRTSEAVRRIAFLTEAPPPGPPHAQAWPIGFNYPG